MSGPTDTGGASSAFAVLDALEELPGPRVEIGAVVDAFARRGFAALLFVLAVPLGLPTPAPPPLNFLFGIPLLFIAGQILLGLRTPYVPGWLRSKTLPQKTLTRAARIARRWLGRIERFVRPRLPILAEGRAGHYALGAGCAVVALSVFVPYPMSNTVPSFFIAMAAFGRMTGDGAVMAAGLIGGVAWVALLVGGSFLLGTQIAAWV